MLAKQQESNHRELGNLQNFQEDQNRNLDLHDQDHVAGRDALECLQTDFDSKLGQ